MDAVLIGFFWGGFFATAALLMLAGLAVFAQLHHQIAVNSVVTALLTALFVASYLGWLPLGNRDTELRVISHIGIAAAMVLGVLLLIDLGLLRERESRRRLLRGTVGATAVAVAASWFLSATQALILATSVAVLVALLTLGVSIRAALRGDRAAWLAAASLLSVLVLLAGLGDIALDRPRVGWVVHAVSAVAGGMFLTAVGAMLWLRHSYLMEVGEVIAQGPRYDPVTRLRSSSATGQMVAHAFERHRHTDRPLMLIGVSIGNLYALENLHGRAAVNHALFVCASRLRRCVPAGMDIGRLVDDGFLLVSRNSHDVDRLLRVARRVASQLSQPVLLHTSSELGQPDDEHTEWAAHVGVGLLTTSPGAPGRGDREGARHVSYGLDLHEPGRVVRPGHGSHRRTAGTRLRALTRQGPSRARGAPLPYDRRQLP